MGKKFRSIVGILVAVAVLFALTVGVFPASGLGVDDGKDSFETDAEGWISFAGEQVEVTDEQKSEGEKSLKVKTNAWWGGAAYQNLALEAGKTYQFTMDVRLSTLTEGNYTVWLFPSSADATGTELASKPVKLNNTGFTTVTLEYTPQKAEETAMLLIRATGEPFDTVFYLDNVSMQVVDATGHEGNSVPAENLIAGGSFEEGIDAAAGFSGGTVAAYDKASYDGEKSLIVSTVNWYDGVAFRNFTLEKGYTYIIKAYARYAWTTSPSVDYELALYEADTDTAEAKRASIKQAMKADGWTEFTITVVPENDYKQVMLLLRSTGGVSGAEHYDFLIDGVQMTRQEKLPDTVVQGHEGNPVPEKNLIEGGSLEEGASPAQGFAAGAVTPTDVASYDGSHAVLVNTNDWWDGVCVQNIELKKGVAYKVSVFARYRETTSNPIDYELSLWPEGIDQPNDAKLVSCVRQMKADGWVEFSFTYTPEEDLDTAMLLLRSTGGPVDGSGNENYAFYADAFVVTEQDDGEDDTEVVIIPDGGFEEGNAAVGFATGTVERSDAMAYEGDYSLKVNTSNWWDGAAFTGLTLEKGKTFTFSAYVRLAEGEKLEHMMSLGPTDPDQPADGFLASDAKEIGTDGWVKLSFTYTCEETSSTYMLLIRSTGGADGASPRTFHIDNVEVVPTNPSTGVDARIPALAGCAAVLAAAGLIVLGKKRRAQA